MNPLKLMNPLTVIKGAVGLAGTAVGVVETLVRGTAHVAASGLQRLTTPDHSGLDDDEALPADPTEVMDASASPERVDLPFEPHAPDEPLIDVVGEALAREAALEGGQSLEGTGFAHEPRPASRAEEHGEAPFQRVDNEEIDDEVISALEGDLEDDLEDGDEAEDELSEPLIDPGDVKALATETAMLSRAADPDKG